MSVTREDKSHPCSDFVSRDPNDDRNVVLEWTPAVGADGYLVRYGISPDKLWQCVQIQDGSKSRIGLHTLNRKVDYYFRLDAFNEKGITEGKICPPEQVRKTESF